MNETTINKKNDNSKVPMAVLSCFLIAFILQGILKISGIFIFEKALNWEIFEIIDNNKFLQIIYYSIILIIPVYCLSFALTSKPYSNKFYHYLIIILVSFGVTICKFNIKTPLWFEYVYDILTYIITPLIIYLTSDKNNRLFKDNSIQNLVIVISIEILLYFCNLGLCYWSVMLNSIIPTTQVVVYVSTHFLIFFEMYIGLILLMLSLNMFISKKEVI